jgi:glycosyltransferase involved in cell wall biosynthesis
MITIVIPLYNKERQVLQTLQTVFAQSYTDYEVVVVDDGSTDSGAALVESLGDSRIRLIHQANVGVSAARNRGIAEARGEYVAFLDADDEWDSDYLATQMSLAERYPTCSVFATNYRFRDQLGRETPTILRHLRLAATDGILTNYFEVASDSHPPLWTSAIMVRTAAIRAIGGFPLGIRLGEDLITWAKLACQYKIAFTQRPAATYVFASQADRVVPDKKPNMTDTVGEEYAKLVKTYDIPYLKETAALWHKMRMVTFVQLQMRKEARAEYAKIKGYITPPKKYKIWYILSYMPIAVTQFLLKSKSGFK